MPSNKLIITLIIISLFLLAGVGFFFFNSFLPGFHKEPNNQNLVVASQNVNQNSNYPSDDSLFRKAVAEKNMKYCDQVKQMTKENCLYIVAIALDQSFCKQVTDAALQTRCFSFYGYKQALADGDLTKCQSLQDQDLRKQCLAQIFMKQNDLNYCAKFQDADKILCYDLINQTLAKKNADAKFCQAISDQSIKTNCNNIVTNLPADSNHNGVPDYVERSWGLDPFKPNNINK